MKTIIEMAREAGIIHPEMVEKTLEAFAEFVRADEREACEALCKWRTGIQQVDAAIDTCAAAIRARGNT